MHRILCRSLVLSALLLSVLPGFRLLAAEASRTSLNEGWRFIRYGHMPDGSVKEEPAALESPVIDDGYWRELDLPHDWGIEGPFRKDLPGSTGKLPWAGIGWYRKQLFVPATAQGMRHYIDLDGAMSQAKVYLNGEKVGERPYGYSSFRVDLTPKLKLGANNLIAIRLDNPPDSSRWYPGGGIYRNVWLVRAPQVHFEQWGIFVRTAELNASRAVVAIDGEITNKGTVARNVTVRYEILRRGLPKPITSVELPSLNVAANSNGDRITRMEVPNPVLWSPERPELYVLKATLFGEGRELLETQEIPFGIRKAEFTANDGFHLNGQRVDLRGVCEHHDLGPLGSAFNVSAMERRLRILKSMGVNAIRTAHNPPAPELLDLCDRMGFLVMDEAFDCWRMKKTTNDYARHFDAWHERDLSGMVRRDRNHASVILWSIGNEIREQWQINGVELAIKLRDIVRSNDDTRPVTMGLHNKDAVQNGFYKGADVIGLNYKPFMYAEARATAPGVPMLAAETASTVSSRGVYLFPVSEEPQGGFGAFQVSSYDLYVPRWAQKPDTEFAAQEKNRFVAGEFVWTGFDYLGEPTPFNDDKTNALNYQSEAERAKAEAELAKMGGNMPSRSSYFGILDLCGFPKDRFYLYQSHWRPDVPVAHILPHWNWEGREGQVTPVFVYSNGDEAELFVNDRSQGRKRMEPGSYRFRWDKVVYEAGEVRVVAYRNGRRWAKDSVRTAGKGAKMEIAEVPQEIRSDGQQFIYIDVSIVDADGNFVPDARQRVSFFPEGPLEVVAVCNGDATSFEPFKANSILSFNGRAQAIIRAKKGAEGRATLMVRSVGLTENPVEFRIRR